MNKRIKKVNPLVTVVNDGTFNVNDITHIGILKKDKVRTVKIKPVFVEKKTRHRFFFHKIDVVAEDKQVVTFTDTWVFRITFNNGKDLDISVPHESSAHQLRNEVIRKWNEVKANE